MNTGTGSFSLVSDGDIKVDGGAMFGQVPKVLWERLALPDRQNRIRLGLNCILIRTPQHNILVDTGIGSKEPQKTKEMFGLGTSQLLRELKAQGVSAKDIDMVILTHLHFDHVGGCTKLDRAGLPVPSFPSATYYIQRAAWEEATDPNERAKASYHADDFVPLQDVGRLRLLDGDAEVASGVWVKVTDGHTPGHQIVYANHGGERIACLGDLVPTPHHLKLPYITSYDHSPEETLKQKRELLDRAEQEGWLLLFSHGCPERAGYLERKDGKRQFRAVEM